MNTLSSKREYNRNYAKKRRRRNLKKKDTTNYLLQNQKVYSRLRLGVVKEPMFLLLVACGTLYLILGDIQEGLMLLKFCICCNGDRVLPGEKN